MLQQEADLTAGYGILCTTGLIAVTAQDVDELERAVADMEQAAIQSSCEARRLWGQQAQAFTAAPLPLCRMGVTSRALGRPRNSGRSSALVPGRDPRGAPSREFVSRPPVRT